MSKLLSVLSLRRATLAHIEAQLRDGGGEERQPPPRKFVFSDERVVNRKTAVTSQTLQVWTGQDPGERIANTILLCAIRDRAHQVTLEPGAKGVKVRFQIESGVLREQKLPAFALEPIVRHFNALTQHEVAAPNPGAPSEVADVRPLAGEVRIAVDEQFYKISFSPLVTQWGAGVKVQFSI